MLIFSIFVQFFWGLPLNHPSRLCDIHEELYFVQRGVLASQPSLLFHFRTVLHLCHAYFLRF